ncbi:MAG: hypothetical protein LVQ96_04755 [Thermoplasmatales archaeon]|nr:hypothetical protein [Thermoplasmatales archaeon]MCW6170464.1 hypothetical protein [Thermoplasmatales archaeon]
MQNPEQYYDLIISGAGFAGLSAAIIASRKLDRVLLIDRNPSKNVGKKTNWGWVCGDAIGKPHIDFLERKIGVSFGSPEIERDFHAVYALSPDLRNRFKFDGDGYALDRPEFEARLLRIALKTGTKYLDNFEIDGPILEGNNVSGIYGRDQDNQLMTFRSKVVIDALGISSILRRKLPENPFIQRNVERNDIVLTGRYIFEYDRSDENPSFFDKSNALIHLNNDIAPGGYAWVFPKGENRVNIGLGVQQAAMETRNQKFKMNDTVKSLLDNYVKLNSKLHNLRIYDKNNNGTGFWTVSVRRQLDSIVFNGYMGAGDSMTMPNPLSAAGIGPAVIAGVLSAENAIRAIEERDVSVRGLWNYNLDYNNAYGNKMGGMELFRIYLQSLSNKSLNYGMEKFLTPEEASEITLGGVPKLSALSKLKFALRGLGDIKAFKGLVYTVQQMRFMDELYRNYPKNPDKFVTFSTAVKSEIEQAKQMFSPLTL